MENVYLVDFNQPTESINYLELFVHVSIIYNPIHYEIKVRLERISRDEANKVCIDPDLLEFALIRSLLAT